MVDIIAPLKCMSLKQRKEANVNVPYSLNSRVLYGYNRVEIYINSCSEMDARTSPSKQRTTRCGVL